MIEDEEGVHLTPEEEADLAAALAEADRTTGVPAEQILRELREMTDEELRKRR
jgi:hypothetical protein